jgi:23S rRNA (cytosine1962-C5)-methyltransferase
MKSIWLKPGKERSLLRGHPWTYDSAVAKGGGDSGETVRVCTSDGKFLAWAAYSPKSKIRARVWSFDEAQRIDATFLEALISTSIGIREKFPIKSDGKRIIHGEADGLPGLIVDRYGDTLVAQFLSAGMERFKAVIVAALLKSTGLERLYERSDSGVRQLEGLPEAKGWLSDTQGDTSVTIQEHGWKLALDVEEGHKTGFYLDQRDNRQKFSEYAQRLQFKRVLNCYCYTGGFTVAALAGGAAHVTSIDSSGPAVEKAKQNVALNGFDASRCTFLDADVNASLRKLIAEGASFDAIVLDPPKFAPTAAHAERAARAYKDINRLALKLLDVGGVLFTFSCSGGIDADLFHKIVASAGTDAHVDAYICERLSAAPDHPMTVNFPEGEYLKGLVLMKKPHAPRTRLANDAHEAATDKA